MEINRTVLATGIPSNDPASDFTRGVDRLPGSRNGTLPQDCVTGVGNERLRSLPSLLSCPRLSPVRGILRAYNGSPVSQSPAARS